MYNIFVTACYHLDSNVQGHDLEEQAQFLSPYQCQVSCQVNPKCLYFTYNTDTKKCFLKNGIDGVNYGVIPGCVSGPAFCDGKVEESGCVRKTKSKKVLFLIYFSKIQKTSKISKS